MLLGTIPHQSHAGVAERATLSRLQVCATRVHFAPNIVHFPDGVNLKAAGSLPTYQMLGSPTLPIPDAATSRSMDQVGKA